jgi:hypothetical protein
MSSPVPDALDLERRFPNSPKRKISSSMGAAQAVEPAPREAAKMGSRPTSSPANSLANQTFSSSILDALDLERRFPNSPRYNYNPKFSPNNVRESASQKDRKTKDRNIRRRLRFRLSQWRSLHQSTDGDRSSASNFFSPTGNFPSPILHSSPTGETLMRTCLDNDSFTGSQSLSNLPNNILAKRLREKENELEALKTENERLNEKILTLENEKRRLGEDFTKSSSASPVTEPPTNNNEEFILNQSKKKRKKKRKEETHPPSATAPHPQPKVIPPLMPPVQSVHQPPHILEEMPTPQYDDITTIHFYTDSNTRDIHPQLISNHINRYNTKLKHPTKIYKIQIHTTYDLEKTQKDMHTCNHTNSIVIINNLTNHARRQHKIPKVNYHLHTIIEHLQTQTPHIIITEAAPSLKFDIYPYNRAAFNVASKHHVQWAPTLIGEAHILRDRVHIHRHHYPLLAQTYAAAIKKQSPYSADLQRPPHGPFGPWWFPWGHPQRPHPSSHWPPSPSFFKPHRLPHYAPETWSNVACAPASHFRQRPLT